MTFEKNKVYKCRRSWWFSLLFCGCLTLRQLRVLTGTVAFGVVLTWHAYIPVDPCRWVPSTTANLGSLCPHNIETGGPRSVSQTCPWSPEFEAKLARRLKCGHEAVCFALCLEKPAREGDFVTHPVYVEKNQNIFRSQRPITSVLRGRGRPEWPLYKLQFIAIFLVPSFIGVGSRLHWVFGAPVFWLLVNFPPISNFLWSIEFWNAIWYPRKTSSHTPSQSRKCFRERKMLLK